MNHSPAVAAVVAVAEAAAEAVEALVLAVAARVPVAEALDQAAAPRDLRQLPVDRHRSPAAGPAPRNDQVQERAVPARAHPRAHVPQRDPRQALVPAPETSPEERGLMLVN